LGAVSGDGIRLSFLRFGPESLFIVEGHLRETWFFLDRPEAPLELAIGLTQCGFWLNVKMSCEVHDRKEQVTKLIELAIVIGFRIEFRQLLVDLRSWAGNVRPVEADTRGAPLELGGPFESGQGQRYAGTCALVGVGGAFLGLDDLPQVMTTMFRVAEDVRVAAFHLVADPAENVLQREQAGFLSHACVENDLELKVAKFIRECVHVLACDGVCNFVGFFDRVRSDGVKGLHAVPFAAADRIAQSPHDFDEPLKRHEGPLHCPDLKV